MGDGARRYGAPVRSRGVREGVASVAPRLLCSVSPEPDIGRSQVLLCRRTVVKDCLEAWVVPVGQGRP